MELSKTVQKCLVSFEKAVTKGLSNRGRLGHETPVGDLFVYKKLITMIKENQIRRAKTLVENLNSIAQQKVPQKILYLVYSS